MLTYKLLAAYAILHDIHFRVGVCTVATFADHGAFEIWNMNTVI